MESNPPFTEASMEHPLWKEIKESECYLVSCMYEEASASSSSVLQKLLTKRPGEVDVVHDDRTLENGISELDDIMEAAGMVFIQANKQIHRTRDIFHDLKTLFGSVAFIPYSVLFTGLCMQLYEGEYQIAREALDEFFKGWVFAQDVSWYIPSEAERQKAPLCIAQNSHLSMKKYLQIVELYAVNVLVKGLKNEELALKWLEKLNILEESRQEIVLKIKSLSRLQESKSVKCFSHPSSGHEQKLSQAKDLSLSKGVTEFSQMSKALSGSKEHLQTVDICTGSNENSVVSRFSKLVESLFLWFPALPLRLGNLGTALPHGKTILILASTLFIFYLLKSKSKYAIRKLKEQSQVVQRVLIDFWQLAFNVQLNPLAAVQPLPSAPHVGRRERVRIRSLVGERNLVGTIICVGGAMLVTLCKDASSDDNQSVSGILMKGSLLLGAMVLVFILKRGGPPQLRNSWRAYAFIMFVVLFMMIAFVSSAVVNNTDGVPAGTECPPQCQYVVECDSCVRCCRSMGDFFCCD